MMARRLAPQLTTCGSAIVRTLVCALLAATTIGANSQATSTQARPAEDSGPVSKAGVVTRARELVQKEVDAQRLPGLSIAVVVKDQLVWSEGFGFADLESASRATGSTIYRIGSISKPIVATALMQLVERGRVDLDADIRTYVAEWPQKPWPVTVRHLLTHTSGIRHYRGDEFLSVTRYTDLAGPLATFKNDPLLFQPGTKLSYSTHGFNLVANIVERAGGLSIAEYMRLRVYEPAWMNNTGLEDWNAIQKGRARWYETKDSRWINTPYVDLSNKYAGGGLTSTVEDLARLHIAYARGVVLKPETIRLMYTNQRLADGSTNTFGLSWVARTVTTSAGRSVREVSHSGGSVGANSLLVRYPNEGFAVAAIANHAAKLTTIVQRVVTLFEEAGAFGAAPATAAPATVP
jgi:serine beta-lactamase-like protein LACTB, mitochondrial